jgi:hypothetical protein
MRRALLLLIAVAGCGGEDDSALEGVWMMDYDASCGLALSVDKGRYSVIDACELNTGGLGADVEVGSYTIDGGTITFNTEQWTCPDGETTTRLPFAVNGDQLTLASSGGTLLMKRYHSMEEAVGGSIQYGCFADDGKFTPAQLRPVR